MNFERNRMETTQPLEGADMLKANALGQELGLIGRLGRMNKMARGLLAGFVLATAIGCTKEPEKTERKMTPAEQQQAWQEMLKKHGILQTEKDKEEFKKTADKLGELFAHAIVDPYAKLLETKEEKK